MRKSGLNASSTFVGSFGEEESGNTLLAVSFVIAVITADSAFSAGSILSFEEASRAFGHTGILEESEGLVTFKALSKLVHIARFAVFISAFQAGVVSENKSGSTLSDSFRGIVDASRFGLHLGGVVFGAFSNASGAQVLEHSEGAGSTSGRTVNIAFKAVRVGTGSALVFGDVVVESFSALLDALFISAEDLGRGTFLAALLFTALFAVALAFLALLGYSIIELVERAGGNAGVVGEFIRGIASDASSSVLVASFAVSVVAVDTLSVLGEFTFRAGLSAVAVDKEEVGRAFSASRSITAFITVVLA